MTVNLTGVADVQKITVSLSAVTDSFGQVLPDTAVSVNMLVGDINGEQNRQRVRHRRGQSAVGRAGHGGELPQRRRGQRQHHASDIGLVKSRSGQSVP